MKTLREILDEKGYQLEKNEIKLPIPCMTGTDGPLEIVMISDRVAVVRKTGSSTNFCRGFSQILVEEDDIVLIPRTNSRGTWGQNGGFARPMMGDKTEVWTCTGCVDCGEKIRHPEINNKNYVLTIKQIYDDRDITVKEDRHTGHFLILVKTPGVQKMFASCKGNYSTIIGSDVKEIMEFAKGDIS